MSADAAPQSGRTPRPLALEVDVDVGKYRSLVELGHGGMGVVTLAVLRGPSGFHKLLALKQLRREHLDDTALVAMFMDEARLAARLNHPNIVQTIEAGAHDGRPFLAMEYLEGQPLRQLVHRALAHATRIPLRMHLGILLDVLSALEYAHHLTDFDGTPLDIVHRDVSPHNVVITYEGQIKLVDFGSSKSVDHPGEARADVITGKMRYMAPEQASGGHVDRTADVFAAGVMLWEAIVGRRPWEGQPDSVVMRNLTAGIVPRVRDEWPDVDPALAEIVERAMSADPTRRYPTALAMRNDLEGYVASRNMAAPSTRSLGASVARLFAEDRDRLRAQIDARLRALAVGEDGVRSSTLHKISMTLPAAGSVARPVSSPPRSAASNARGWKGGAFLAAGAAAIGAVMALGAVASGRMRVGAPVQAAAASIVPVPTAVSIAPAAAAPLAVAPAVVRPIAAPTASIGVAPDRASHVVIVASPPAAQLSLDDVTVANPFVADRAADAIVHRLRVEAPGYETKTRVLTFAADIEIEIDLAAIPAPSRPARADHPVASPPAQPRAQAPSLSPRPALSPRPIDTGDPY